MVLITVPSYGILHLISSNYNIGKTEMLLGAMSEGHIFAAIKSFAGMFVDGLRGLFDLRFYVKSNGVYIFHVMIALLITVSSVITIFSKNAEKEDVIITAVSLYSICMFFFMYMTLYTIVPDTFMRGTEIAVIFSLYFLMMTKDRYLAWAIVICNATGLLFLPVNLRNFAGEERYYTKAQTAEWRELENDLKDAIGVKESDDPWENTVLMYTMEPKAILAIPEGMGLNFILHNDYYGTDPEYLFFAKYPHYREDWIEQDYGTLMMLDALNIEFYYETVYERNGYICYRKR